MSKLAIFRQQASVGARVTLRLKRGEDVSGRIAQLDDAYVCLDLGGRTVTIFADILAGWELHHKDRAGEVSMGRSESLPSTAVHGMEAVGDEHQETMSDDDAPAPERESTVSVASALARIEAGFSEAIKRARLENPEPDFKFPGEAFPSQNVDAVQREWDRARNKYEYALKVKEPHRLNDVVAQILAPLAEEYPDSAATRSLLGRVLLRLGRQSDAMEHLVAAAALSDAPENWLALASAAGKNTPTECYALRRYFGLTPPRHAKEAWFRYLGTANPIDLSGAAHVIHHWSADKQQEDSNRDLLLSESLIHLLLSSGSQSLARQAAANLVHLAGKLPIGWQGALDHSTSPSEELRAIERRFLRLFGRIASPAQPIRPGEGSRERAAAAATPEQIRGAQRPFTGLPVRTPLSALPLPPEGGDALRHGRIKSFGNQRFGFLDEHGGDTFFFRIDYVTDDALRDALLDGSWKESGDVEFKGLPSPGHKYSRAVEVVPMNDAVSLLRRAHDLRRAGRPAQAMACVRRVLRADPTDDTARQLEEDIKQDARKQLREHGAGLPKGSGPYARARRAQLVDQDLRKAEQLLKQAVRDHDKPGSAIKDLAALLQQQGRDQEAIALLTEHANRFKHDTAYRNTLATLYQHADRHDDAIKVLTTLLDSAESPEKRLPLLKRIAYSHFKCDRYDDAERALKTLLAIAPHDPTAARWLAGLEDARNSDSVAEAEEIISGLGEPGAEGVELSSLAHAAIEQCTYEGVDPKRLQAGTAGDKEVARGVVRLAMELGTSRPRDRAGYYLSAAALLKQHQSDGTPGLIHDYLRRYFASMAAASWTERNSAEVVRSYHIESLRLVSENDNLDEAWRSLLSYLATFSRAPLDDVQAAFPRGRRGQTTISRRKYTGAIQRTLEMIAPEAETGWMEGVLAVGSQSSFARNAIGDALRASQSLQAAFDNAPDSTCHEVNDVPARWQSDCREYARSHRKFLSACRSLTNCHATVASMEDLRAELTRFSDRMNSEVDRRRLTSLIDIVEPALAFCRAPDYEVKERNYWLVTTRVDSFREDVVNAPTQHSREGLLPIADHLKSLIEEEYAGMAQTSGAELSLRLLVDQYMRRQDGKLSIQIEVSNKPGCSPASSVRIRLGPDDSEYFVADHREREVVSTLRGGGTEVTQMTVHPRDVALKDRAFPINAVATYQNTLGETVQTSDHAWTVRLYPEDEFLYLDNPYTPFAEGGPVDEPTMFVGRDELLDRLEHSLLAGSGSKSIVMFGQKRAGKSSLLEHLRRRLTRKRIVVPVCFSLLDIASDLSVPSFLHRILQGASDVLEDLRYDGRDVPEFSPPAIEEMESHPTLRFHDAMASLVRTMKRHPSDLNFVFLIDEFTDIFKEIRRGRIQRQFMKAWKAIVEKRYFASVLVGQDIMPAFKAEFPNEFGVTEDIRVTYLDDTAAATLVQKPIGEERFAGRAVKWILDLTAGSPYYTMMLCARLVDYMNTTRSVKVTEADVLAVEDEMLRGERRLTTDKFDNLLSAGDGVLDSGIDPDDTYAVCAAIAQGSETEMWCSRNAIRGFGEPDLNKLLLDVETRDVVERKGNAYRLRVGLFRDWLVRRG